MKTCRWLCLLLALLLCASAAHGLIAAALEMEKILGDSKYVVMAKVTTFDPEKKQMILTIGESIMGKDKKGNLKPGPAFQQIAVVMQGDKDAEKYKHMPELMKRLAVGLPVVLFIAHKGNDTFITYLYTNGTWIELKGKGNANSPGVWDLTHGEPILRKTFKGTTEQMSNIVKGFYAGDVKLPRINEKEKEGFGPEVSQGK